MPDPASCFRQHPHLVRNSAWLQYRRVLLANQLQQYQVNICNLIRQQTDLRLPESDEQLNAYYQAWAQSLQEEGADVYQRWQGFAGQALSQQEQVLMAWRFLGLSQDYLDAGHLFVARVQLQQAQTHAHHRHQAQQLNQAARQIAETTTQALRDSEHCYSIETIDNQNDPLDALEQDLQQVIQDWHQCESDSSLSLTLNFVRLFAQQIISPYRASVRFWETFLLNLHQQIRYIAKTDPEPVLSSALEALIAAVPRYDFLGAYSRQCQAYYENMPLTPHDTLIYLMIGNARPQTQFYLDLLNANLIDWQARQIADLTSLQQSLKQIQAQAENDLRGAWERNQIDWYSDASEWLYRQIENANLIPELLQHHSPALEQLSTGLSEGMIDAESHQRLSDMLANLLELILINASQYDSPQPARVRLKWQIALFISPDQQWTLWRKHLEIIAALKNLSPHKHSTRLWQQVQTLFNSLETLLTQFCQQALSLPEELKQQSANTQALWQQMLDNQYLYPSIQAEKATLQYLLTQADFSELNEKNLQDWQQQDSAPLRQQLAKTLTKTLAQALAIQQLQAQIPNIAADCAAGNALLHNNNLQMLDRLLQTQIGLYHDPQADLAWWQLLLNTHTADISLNAWRDNLSALQAGLKQHINNDVLSQQWFERLHQIYNQVLGKDVLKVEQKTAHHSFISLPLKGERWQQLHGENAPLPAFLDDFTDCAEKYQHGGAPQGPLCLDLGSDSLAEPLQQQLQSLLHHYLVDGDLDAAFQGILNDVNNGLESYSCEELEIAWRQLLALLSEALPIARSSYWTLLFLQAIETLRQAALGRYLENHATQLGEELYNHLNHLSSSKTSEAPELVELCLHLGRILRYQPASLAALNSGRYLIEQAMPQLNYPAPVWHVLWLRLSDLCFDALDSSERLALSVWIEQWDSQSQLLPKTQSLGQTVFASKELVFSEDLSQEQDWRALLSGMLTAAITPDTAPMPAKLLSQRLVLSSHIFTHEHTAAWQGRYSALEKAFIEQLPEQLCQHLQTQHLVISQMLSRLPVLEQLEGLPRINRFLFALSHSALHQNCWQLGCLIQAAEQSHYQPSAAELFLMHDADYMQHTEEQLKAQAALYTASCFYRPAEYDEINPTVHEELAVSLRIAALSDLHGQSPTHLQRWLLSVSAQIRADLGEGSELQIQNWLAQLSQQAEEPALQTLALALTQAWHRIALAERLIFQATEYASLMIQQSPPQMNDKHLSFCQRDIGFMLRYLGLYLAGFEQGRSPALWYWQHVGSFLSLQVRDESRNILPQMASALNAQFAEEDQALLAELFAELYGVFDLPEWSQAPAYHIGGKSSRQDMNTRGMRHFSPLSYMGAHWQTVFAHSQPDPMLLNSLQAHIGALWSDSHQAPPLYIANVVSAHLTAFVTALKQCGGDEEIAWQQIMPLLDEALQQIPAENLCSTWQALGLRLPSLLGEQDSVYWQGLLQRAALIVQQVALGRLIAQHSQACAEFIGQHFMPMMNDSGQTHKCQRDQALLLEQIADNLRTQAPTLAALNISRYLLEMIMPFVAYNGSLWQMVWMQLQAYLSPHCDHAEQLGLNRWIAQLDALVELLPYTRELGLNLFHTDTSHFSEDNEQEQAWQVAVSGLLCAALTPENAPISGQALVQRLVLSSVVFESETSDSWQARQQQLDEVLLPYLDSSLHVPLLMRHAQIISCLMKLPRFTGQPSIEGIDSFAALLSGLHEAEGIWHSLQWRHQAGQTGISLQAKDVMIGQLLGWTIPSWDQIQQNHAVYHAACQIEMNFVVVWHKWRLGGLLGRIDSNSLQLSHEQQGRIQIFLRRWVLLCAQNASASLLKAQLFELFMRFADYLPEQREALVINLHQHVSQTYGETHPINLSLTHLKKCLPEVNAAVLLLSQTESLVRVLLPHHPECQADMVFLLRRLGLHLAAIMHCRHVGEWYWQHIGIFLSPDTSARAQQILTELIHALPKQFLQSQVPIVEALVQDIILHLRAQAHLAHTSSKSSPWKLH